MFNGPLISAHGRLNWSDNLKVGLENLFAVNTFANISLYSCPKAKLCMGTESASNQTVDIPGKFVDQVTWKSLKSLWNWWARIGILQLNNNYCCVFVVTGNKNNCCSVSVSVQSYLFKRFSLQIFLLQAFCFTFCKLSSLPIDELGEGAYESGWWCQAKCEPWAGCAGIDCNPESRNHHQAPSHWETAVTKTWNDPTTIHNDPTTTPQRSTVQRPPNERNHLRKPIPSISWPWARP